MSHQDRLIIDETLGISRIFWEVYGDEYGWEMGAVVGEGRLTKNPPKNLEDREVWLVNKAVATLKPDRDETGFRFDSQTEVKAALRVAKAALKSNKLWPDWAIKAKAAGWHSPKGWKP